MDQSGNVRHLGPGSRRNKAKRTQSQNPQLFEDTSTQQYNYGQQHAAQQPPYYDPHGQNQAPQAPYYDPGIQNPGPVYDPNTYGRGTGGAPQQQPQFPGEQFLNDPMANMALKYGTTLADQGKDYVNKNIEKYVSVSKVKYYFAVDTAYVGKKLGLLVFPFTHTDWSVRYDQNEPVAPRYDVNAPDLYIPVMAFVTYILMAGYVLGTQNRFTPEQLGIIASHALVWLVIEILAMLFTLYLTNLSTDLKYLDLLAYCGYKYVGMIACLAGALLGSSMAYYGILLWMSITIVFFLVRTLKLQIISQADSDGFSKGGKRRLYLLLFIAGIQPVFMWWLTHHLVVSGKTTT